MNQDRPASILFQEFAGELVTSGYGFRFQAKGRSMLPTIRDGEILQVDPVISGGPKLGHIVLFRKGEELRTHRIIGKSGNSFIIRGDAGIDDDGEIPRSQVLGLVVAKHCSVTGRRVRLDTFAARAIFFAREFRRRALGLKQRERAESTADC